MLKYSRTPANAYKRKAGREGQLFYLQAFLSKHRVLGAKTQERELFPHPAEGEGGVKSLQPICWTTDRERYKQNRKIKEGSEEFLRIWTDRTQGKRSRATLEAM